MSALAWVSAWALSFLVSWLILTCIVTAMQVTGFESFISACAAIGATGGVSVAYWMGRQA